MKKGITKEQVIEKTLEITRDNQDFSKVNLRVIAREVGCAHTNLYNYFSNFDQLLCEVYIKVLSIFSAKIMEGISGINDYILLLRKLFNEIIDFYLSNRGWFRLLWIESISGIYKEAGYIEASKSADKFVYIIEKNIKNNQSEAPAIGQLKNYIHIVHCYIYGEVSLYISNHSFIQTGTNTLQKAGLIPFTADRSIPEETSFRKYVVDEAMKIFLLFLKKE